jgi:hypothetical protein
MSRYRGRLHSLSRAMKWLRAARQPVTRYTPFKFWIGPMFVMAEIFSGLDSMPRSDMIKPRSMPGLSRCVAWEVVAVARPLRGMRGCGRPGPWHGRLEGSCGWPEQGLSRPRSQLAGDKTKYKSVDCKEKTQICI